MQWSRKTLPSMQSTRRSSSPNGRLRNHRRRLTDSATNRRRDTGLLDVPRSVTSDQRQQFSPVAEATTAKGLAPLSAARAVVGCCRGGKTSRRESWSRLPSHDGRPFAVAGMPPH